MLDGDKGYISIPGLPASLYAEDREGVAVLWLNRPHKRNALDDELVQGLQSFFQNLPPTTKAVVIAGRGNHFSAGLDLSTVQEHSTNEAIVHSRSWHKAFESIEFGNVPVVSVLHGAVVGGGLELAAATHVRVAERSAYYALPEGQRGIFVGGGGSVRLPRLIGVSRMMEMMLTGRTSARRKAWRWASPITSWKKARASPRAWNWRATCIEQSDDELCRHARFAAHRRKRNRARLYVRGLDGGHRASR